MNKNEVLDAITDDLVTVIAIIGIVVLGLHGVVDAEVIGAIAGLGGYRLYKNGKE